MSPSVRVISSDRCSPVTGYRPSSGKVKRAYVTVAGGGVGALLAGRSVTTGRSPFHSMRAELHLARSKKKTIHS